MLQAVKYIGVPKHIAYYKNLHDLRVVRALRYRFKDKPIIYGFKCQVTNMMYIGSSLAPGLRFHNHLITGHASNANLQAAIAKYGLDTFTAYVFEVVAIPSHLSTTEAKAFLAKIEQTYLDRFPNEQLYNDHKSFLQ